VLIVIPVVELVFHTLDGLGEHHEYGVLCHGSFFSSRSCTAPVLHRSGLARSRFAWLP